MMRAIAIALSLCLAAASAGCGASFHHRTPKGFVELPDQEAYAYRATSADGVVLAVRALEHEPEGEIDFWTEAITGQLRHRGGYALLDERDVETRGGLAGRQLRFGHDEGDEPHLYYVTVFVTGDTLYLLEAGGTAEQMERRGEQIDWAVANFEAE